MQTILAAHPGAREIVIFPPSIGWELPFLFQRPQQMALALARQGCLVFYCEPEYAERHREGFDRIEPGLFIANVPPETFAALDEPVVVLVPYNTEHARHFRRPRIVYEYLDSLDLWVRAVPAVIRAHGELLARATVVTTTATSLWREVSVHRPDTLLSPNGVDYQVFSVARSRPPDGPPPDLHPLIDRGKPLIGYSGAIARWFDYELLRSAALAHPGYTFVLLGTDHDGSLPRSGILDVPNVHWVSAKPHAEIPCYLAHFDVAIIPFVINRLTESTSPVKLFEYLAAGKPVVTTDLPECRRYAPFVARDADEFIRLLPIALASRGDPGYLERADQVARSNTWAARAADLLEALEARRRPFRPEDSGRLGWQVAQLCAALDDAHTETAHEREMVAAVRSEMAVQVTVRENLIRDLSVQLETLREEVEGITGRVLRNALLRIRRVRAALAPPGTRRDRLVKTSVQGLRGLRRGGAAAQQASASFEVGIAGPPSHLPMSARAAATTTTRRGSVGPGAPRVAYLTNQLLDWHTRRPRFGGGERYCLALATLLKELGFDVTFYQAAATPFQGEYYGTKVIGLPLGPAFSEFQYGVCDAFHEVSQGYDRVIHNLPEYASGSVWPDALLICHGVWFDHQNYAPPITFRTREWFRHLYRAFSQPARVVSVDTNSINVIRSLWPDLARRMTYVPNWVDVGLFRPAASRPPGSRVVLFPRRSQVNRGSRILGAILERIPHNDWRFLWVGEGDAEDTQLLRHLAARDPRLEYHSASFEEMPRYYQEADICVIPTVACEGTSLACLEALASGVAVVATCVGGLPDLIQPDLNGLLVDPEPSAIADAINFLIEHPEDRARFQAAGERAAHGFRLEVWRQRWKRLLGELGWITGAR